ncbi:MAG: hypothetical protein PHX53_12345 [Syntrophales bacterium]|nr:hypothetical protein [Syntrophales bacterium]
MAYICFLLNMTSYGQDQTPTNNGNLQKNQTEGRQKNVSIAVDVPQDSAPTILPLVGATTKKITSNETNSRSDKSTADWWLVYFTAALVIVVFFQFIWMLRQEKWMRKTVDLTRQNMISTQRAFVFLKDIDFEPIRAPDDYRKYAWKLSPRWGNSGETPTKNLFISVNCGVFDGELPENFPFPYSAQKNVPMLIGPKTDILSEAIELIVKDDRIYYYILNPFSIYRVYMWGEAIYSDIFDGTMQHYTQFCVEMLFTEQQGSGKPLLKSFTYYKKYNCADDDCYMKS